MSPSLRLERQQQIFLKFSSIDLFWFFLFLSYSFGVEKTNTFIRSCGSLENHTRFQTVMVKIYTRFQTKKANTIPFGAAHTYIADNKTNLIARLVLLGGGGGRYSPISAI